MNRPWKALLGGGPTVIKGGLGERREPTLSMPRAVPKDQTAPGELLLVNVVPTKG